MKGHFVLATCGAGHVHCRSLRASSSSPFSIVCMLSFHCMVLMSKLMISLSTVGWRFGSMSMMFRTEWGDIAPPCIWDRRLSWETSSPTNHWSSWLVSVGYRSCRVSTHSSLVGEGGLVDMGNLLLALMDWPPSDMIECWRESRYFSCRKFDSFYPQEGVVSDRF